MQKRDVLAYFGSAAKVARALGLSNSAISQWGENVPPARAIEIERLTNGRLRKETVIDSVPETLPEAGVSRNEF